MLHSSIHIVKYCQQRRLGQLEVMPSDIASIEEIKQSFDCHYQFMMENSHYLLELHFSCVLSLRCQSCWAMYEKMMTVNSRLVFTDDNSEEMDNELSALGYEVVIVDNSYSIKLIELIQEEIYLQIPHIPRCDAHGEDVKGVRFVVDKQGIMSQQQVEQQSNQSMKEHKNTPFQDLLKSLK